MRSPAFAAVAVAALMVVSAAIIVAADQSREQRVSMLAMKFDYLPERVTVTKGEPVVLELSALDRIHGFDVPGLGLRTDIPPGAPTILRFTPEKAGIYNVRCDNFCGDGHEGMTGQIVVTN